MATAKESPYQGEYPFGLLGSDEKSFQGVVPSWWSGTAAAGVAAAAGPQRPQPTKEEFWDKQPDAEEIKERLHQDLKISVNNSQSPTPEQQAKLNTLAGLIESYSSTIFAIPDLQKREQLKVYEELRSIISKELKSIGDTFTGVTASAKCDNSLTFLDQLYKIIYF